MRDGRVECCLASGIVVGERCALRKANKSSLYGWIAVFRGEQPGRFAGRRPEEMFEWAKPPRDGFAASKVRENFSLKMLLGI